jgi:hypothetical protein
MCTTIQILDITELLVFKLPAPNGPKCKDRSITQWSRYSTKVTLINHLKSTCSWGLNTTFIMKINYYKFGTVFCMKKILYGKCQMPTYEQFSLSQCLILILSNLKKKSRMKNLNWINNNYKYILWNVNNIWKVCNYHYICFTNLRHNIFHMN